MTIRFLRLWAWASIARRWTGVGNGVAYSPINARFELANVEAMTTREVLVVAVCCSLVEVSVSVPLATPRLSEPPTATGSDAGLP